MDNSIPIPHHVCSVGEILTAVIEAMRTDQVFFLQFLCTAASHDEETFVNQLLILAQKPDAQSVSDREDWEKIGCQVGESLLCFWTRRTPTIYIPYGRKNKFPAACAGKNGRQSPL